MSSFLLATRLPKKKGQEETGSPGLSLVHHEQLVTEYAPECGLNRLPLVGRRQSRLQGVPFGPSLRGSFPDFP